MGCNEAQDTYCIGFSVESTLSQLINSAWVDYLRVSCTVHGGSSNGVVIPGCVWRLLRRHIFQVEALLLAGCSVFGTADNYVFGCVLITAGVTVELPVNFSR